MLVLLLAMPAWVAAEDTDQPKADPKYVKLSPAFIVNLKLGTGARFLQVKAEVLVNSEEDAKEVALHRPAMRHAIIMLLSNQDGRKIRSIETRESLRGEAEEAIKVQLEELAGRPIIEGLFFTNFVVQ
jgi:flagellar FliL protein